MEKSTKVSIPISKKRKRKLGITITTSEPKTMKLDGLATKTVAVQKAPMPDVMYEGLSMDEIGEKYPILKNKELVNRFLNVSMNNNQKGRIRQNIRDNLKGTTDTLLPEVIHNKIQAILKSSTNLNDADLRKIRILYNMLNTTLQNEKKDKNKEKVVKKDKTNADDTDKPKKIKKEKIDNVKVEDTEKENDLKKENNEQPLKVKGPKRYVVFLGNLPLDIDKDKIMKHFSDLNDHIKDIRIPPHKEKKSAIAYVELNNEPSFELALSKHHSMLDNKRINVLYTTQQKSKISKTEAKSKTAKLIALRHQGKLIGSLPANKKRSHRRKILKQARAKEAQNA